MAPKKQIIMIGDRVLIDPEVGTDRTQAGLYLPPTVKEKDKVQGGSVIKVGPGYPFQDPNRCDEPWAAKRSGDLRYIPLQIYEGDYALFLRDAAFEIEFDGRKLLIVPYGSILAVVRGELGL